MKNGMERGSHATKSDLKELEERILDTIRGDLLNLEERLMKAVHDTAELLAKAFYNLAEAQQLRAVQLEANQTGLMARIGALEARLAELEKRLNFAQVTPEDKTEKPQ
jgi:transcription elongation GreA/GreB family factor